MRAEPRGIVAARLRQRKFALLEKLSISAEGLPGSFVEVLGRCGKRECHCALGGSERHAGWVLTYMERGKKRVERIPAAWAKEVKERVKAGRAYRESVAEVFVANARLLVLERKQRQR